MNHVAVNVAMLAENLDQALKRVATAVPTVEAIYPRGDSLIKYLHLIIPNAADPSRIIDIYGPFFTDQEPKDGIYYRSEEFEEGEDVNHYSVEEYLEKFESGTGSAGSPICPGTI